MLGQEKSTLGESKDIRCAACGRLFARGVNLDGTLNIRCWRCKKHNLFTLTKTEIIVTIVEH